jgi:hypothetical protein
LPSIPHGSDGDVNPIDRNDGRSSEIISSGYEGRQRCALPALSFTTTSASLHSQLTHIRPTQTCRAPRLRPHTPKLPVRSQALLYMLRNLSPSEVRPYWIVWTRAKRMATFVTVSEDPPSSVNQGLITHIRTDLLRDGFAVVKGIVPKERCAQYVEDIHEWLESFNLGYNRNDPSTVKEECLPIIHQKGLIQAYGAPHEASSMAATRVSNF